MIDISHKSNSLREAIATGILYANPETIARVKAGTVPKGNVLEIARSAGINAAKKTSEIIIFCHSMPLDNCEISYEIGDDYIKTFVKVKSVWKTGVEMEALHAASAVLLNLYDLLKPIDKNIIIRELKLESKRGGKSDFIDHFDRELKTAVLVISDSTFAGTREDKAGKLIKDFLIKETVNVSSYEVLPDIEEQIRKRVKSLIDDEAYDLVICTGGTGLGPKDLTPEAIKPLFDKEIPGVTEAIRRHGKERTPFAMLSRETAGTRNKSIILALPGSSRGAKESLEAIFPGFLHIFPMLWGGGHNKSGKGEMKKELQV